MAKYVMENGSYPINTCADVSDAAKLAHHSGTYSFAQVRAHVMRAKSGLGCPDSVLPATWTQGQNSRSEEQLPQSRQDVFELVERGDVGKSSFAFADAKSDWGLSNQGYPMRTLLTGRLVDVAPCHAGIAAYPDTTAGLRSLAEHFSADYEEVRTLADENDLRRFFVKTGTQIPKKGLLGALALAQLQARRHDPYEDA